MGVDLSERGNNDRDMPPSPDNPRYGCSFSVTSLLILFVALAICLKIPFADVVERIVFGRKFHAAREFTHRQLTVLNRLVGVELPEHTVIDLAALCSTKDSTLTIRMRMPSSEAVAFFHALAARSDVETRMIYPPGITNPVPEIQEQRVEVDKDIALRHGKHFVFCTAENGVVTVYAELDTAVGADLTDAGTVFDRK